MGDPVDKRPLARSRDLIVERLAGETLVYDEARDTVHCLSGAVATVFELCDGARTPAALAALAEQRLGRTLSQAELDEIVTELQAIGVLEKAPAAGGMSRRQVLKAGGGVAAASLITTIVAPVPAAAQSPMPVDPGSPGAPCATTPDCDEGLQCENSECCVPEGGECNATSECCGARGALICDNFGADTPARCVPGDV